MHGYWFNTGGGDSAQGAIPTGSTRNVIPIFQNVLQGTSQTGTYATYDTIIVGTTDIALAGAFYQVSDDVYVLERSPGFSTFSSPGNLMYTAMVGNEPILFDPSNSGQRYYYRDSSAANTITLTDEYTPCVIAYAKTYTISATRDTYNIAVPPRAWTIDGRIVGGGGSETGTGIAKFNKHYQASNTIERIRIAQPRNGVRNDLVGGNQWETPMTVSLNTVYFDEWRAPSGFNTIWGLSYDLRETPFEAGRTPSTFFNCYYGFSETGVYHIQTVKGYSEGIRLVNFTGYPYPNQTRVNITITISAYIVPLSMVYNGQRDVFEDGSVSNWNNNY